MNDIAETSCYNLPVSLIINGLTGCSYTAYVGDGEQLVDDRVTGATQEDKAKLVGGLKYDAYLAITATASDKISSFNVTAVVEGRIVRVYTSLTEYTEDWSDNSAWCELDFKTSVDGCGMDMSSIDLQTYLTAANYYQPSGSPKRFSLNLILDEKKTRQDWMAEIFSCCRSYPTYQRGLHGILVDKPEEVSQIFTVKPDESIETWWQDNSEDIERLQVEYISPEYEYTKVIAQADRVQLAGETSQFRNKIPLTKKISIYGINNFNQASTEAWFHLNKAQTCPEWIQYTTNKRALNRSIGDVVGVKNPITEVAEDGLTYKRYRIMTMSEPQENNITMVMQEYNPNLYGFTMGSVAPVINVTTLPNAMAPPPNVTNISATEYFRDQGNGVILNDLVVTFSPPDYQFYSGSDIYIKSNQPAIAEIDIPISELESSWETVGDSVDVWKFITNVPDKITIQNLIKGHEYSVKVVAVNKIGVKADFDTAPVYKHLIAGKTYTPSTPSGLVVNITDKCEWHWNQIDLDCDFAELRIDQNTGSTTGLLVKTSSTKAVVTPPTRNGVAYLYAHNTSGYYSDPAVVEYNKTAPIAPVGVIITDVFQGFVVATEALPLYCVGINVHIGSEIFFSPNNSYTYKTTGGIYEVSVSFVDIFGEGSLSSVISKTVVATIDPVLIAAESLSKEKMSLDIQAAIVKAQNSLDAAAFYDEFGQWAGDTEVVMNLIGQTQQNIQDAEARLEVSKVAVSAYDTKVAEIKTTTDNISNTVSSNKTATESAISQTNQTVSALTSTVQANKTDADGKASANTTLTQQTATSINQTVSSNLTSTNSAISLVDQKANSISETVQSNKTAVDGSIETLTTLINQTDERVDILATDYVANVTNAKTEVLAGVTSLTASGAYRDNNSEVVQEIKVSFVPPASPYYSHSEIWYKSMSPKISDVNTPINEINVSWDRLGEVAGDWVLAGQSKTSYTITPVVTDMTYIIKVIAVNSADVHSAVTPTVEYSTVGKTYSASSISGFSMAFNNGTCEWSWDSPDSETDFVELRQNGIVLDTTAGTTLSKTPIGRQGIVSIYAHSKVNGTYSTPSELYYSKPKPITPVIAVTKMFHGFVVTYALPDDCTARLYMPDGTTVDSTTNSISVNVSGGTYSIQVEFIDLFGAGDKCYPVTFTIATTVSNALLDSDLQSAIVKANGSASIADLNITKDQVGILVADFSQSIDDAVYTLEALASFKVKADGIASAVANNEGEISTVKQTANGLANTVSANKIDADGKINTVGTQVDQQATQISQIVQGLDSAVTAIAQTDSAVQLRATKADLISLINACPEAITILSRFIHFSGDSLFDDNVIISRMLSVGIGITSPLITGGIITGSRIQNTNNTAYIDGDGNIHGVNITGSTIDANTISQAGYQIKTTIIQRGSISGGSTIPLPIGYTEDQCIWGLSSGTFYYDSSSYMATLVEGTRTTTSPGSTGSAHYWIMGVK